MSSTNVKDCFKKGDSTATAESSKTLVGEGHNFCDQRHSLDLWVKGYAGEGDTQTGLGPRKVCIYRTENGESRPSASLTPLILHYTHHTRLPIYTSLLHSVEAIHNITLVTCHLPSSSYTQYESLSKKPPISHCSVSTTKSKSKITTRNSFLSLSIIPTP